MNGLITSPEQLADERAQDQPLTLRQVRAILLDHDQRVVIPALTQMAQQLQAIEKQRNLAAVVFNNLVEYLEKEGLRISKDGRVYLNQQEWQAWMKKQFEKVNPPKVD